MTSIWNYPDFDAHEGVHLFADPASGLKAVIAVHSTARGPAATSRRCKRHFHRQTMLGPAQGNGHQLHFS